ncbi:NLR family CARD domain-containing protein 3-like [Acropora millepora]|uniref:NLR family CARD domain-containing protein 3-like n=1 Tax=Acropora millepora TaxID=45264 RepID=UPI001CF13DFE|nr:NLR family CARD domain-containing protein 3-like [Acropora millepora]
MPSTSRQPQQHDRTIKVTILASEWGSSKGGLSTISRELAIQLAKFPNVEVTVFLPKCFDGNKAEALSHGISIVEAERLVGYHEELDWLSFPPENLQIDVVVGHGVKLGRQAQVIRKSHKCKWVQVVHTDPEKLGMYKCYENPISKGEQKHSAEVELCQMSDLVVAVGPKLTEAFRKYLRWCERDQNVSELTPGVFADFASVKQALDERKDRSVLIFGRGDDKDFKLKGFDIAARSVTALPDTHLVFVGAPEGKHTDVTKHLLDSGISERRLTVRGFRDREALKREFCEADLVLMPSRTEGFGLTALEAMSAGLPVLVSKNSGFGEALGRVPFGSSFVIDSEDPSAWTAAINGTWNKDRRTRLDEIKVLRDAYGKRYSWSEQCKNLLDRWPSLLVNRQGFPGKDQDFQGRIKRKTKKCSDQDKAGDPSYVIKWIQQIYKKCEGVILPVPWCDRFSFQLENIFTRLRIVAKEKTREKVTKELTSMSSIFTPHEDCQRPMVVLIEGEPGIGKTTYCQKLAYDWATRHGREWHESFPRVEVLLLLRCREIESNCIWKAIEDQILPEGIEPEVRDTFIQFVQENPSKVLLVLDGLDEADPGKLNLFRKLMQGKLLPGCFVVLTSRHEAGSNIMPHTDTLLEIVGFTKTDAECFIRRYFQQSDNQHLAATLIAKLESDNLYELTRNPLNTLLLCVIFEDLNGTLPNARTKLYIEIVLFVLRRYEEKNGLSSSDKDLLLVYNKELMILGEMAQDSLRKGELYFEDHQGDFKQSLLPKFGFVSIQAGGSKRAPCPRYAFFHKSFQEFFSAFFLAFSLIDGTMDCKSVTNIEYEMGPRSVFTFMAGIVAMYSKEIAESIVESFVSVVNLSGPLTTLRMALFFISQCKLFSEAMYTELALSFGKSLDVVGLNLPGWFKPLLSTLCLALTVNTSLTSLDLSHTSIGDEGAKSISEALRVNTSLTSLDLSHNSIHDEGAKSISEALRVNTSLTSLFLDWNSIRDEGAKSLSEALRVNTSLTYLVLDWNSIGGEGAKSLFETLRVNTSLTSLDLSHNSIHDEGAKSLSEALGVNTSLTFLGLDWNSIRDERAKSLSEALRVNTSLTSLVLDWNSIGGEGVKSLSEALRVNTSLTSLDLSHNSIHDEGGKSLSEALGVNTSLTFLGLDWKSIGGEGAKCLSEALRVNTSLTSLDLSHTSIGDEGAKSISEALRVNTSLTSLVLDWNSIGGEGAKSLFETLRVNTSLTSLDLSHNSIHDEGAKSLSEALRVNTSLTSLVLDWNSIRDEGAKSLSEALGVNTSLTFLGLDWNSIGGEGAKCLSEALRVNTSLTSLNLSHTSIGDEGAKSISEALRVNTSLTSLDLSHNSFHDEGAKSLSEALRVNTSLTSLDLSHTYIGDEGANSLFEALRANFLIPLVLGWIIILYEGVKSLSETLRGNTSLTSLVLDWNSIHDEGVKSLSEALRVNTSLTSLDLSHTSIGDEGANSLSEALRVSFLIYFVWGWINVLYEGVKSLSETLRGNTSLTSLVLDWNSIRDEGVKSLSEALRVNTSLTSLDLSHTSIGDEGANSLSEALRVNTSLTCLDLSNNSIRDEGAKSLSATLRVNTSLTSLDLSYNWFGDEGANSLFEAFQVNTTLTSLPPERSSYRFI